MSNKDEKVTISKEELDKLLLAKSSNDKTKNTQRRQWTKTRILVQKAKAAGITVSDAEIDEFIRKNS